MTLLVPLTLLQKGVYATIAYAFIMSITVLSAKIVQQEVPVVVLVFWQSLFCILLLLPQQRGHWQRHPIRVWKIHLLRSLGGFAGFLFYYMALNHIPLIEASLLRACAPLCVPLVVLIMHKHLIPKDRWLPLVLGFIGVVLIIQPSIEGVNPWHVIGFLSAVGLAFSMVTTRMLSKSVRSEETMSIYFILSAVFSLCLAMMRGENLSIPIHLWGWVLLVSLTLYAGMYLYTKAYTFAPASVVSPVSYIGVVFSGFWGWLLWDHLPNWVAILGMTVIFFGILISSQRAKRRI